MSEYGDKTVGQIITEAREKAGITKNQLAEKCKVSHTEIARIESGEREIPNPKTLRKISKYIDVNYNDLMYASGLGFQVTPLNPFLINYYSGLKGQQISAALFNTEASIANWKELVENFTEKLEKEKLSDAEREVIEQTIEDTKYQINTAQEIVNVLFSARRKEEIENAEKK